MSKRHDHAETPDNHVLVVEVDPQMPWKIYHGGDPSRLLVDHMKKGILESGGLNPAGLSFVLDKSQVQVQVFWIPGHGEPNDQATKFLHDITSLDVTLCGAVAFRGLPVDTVLDGMEKYAVPGSG